MGDGTFLLTLTQSIDGFECRENLTISERNYPHISTMLAGQDGETLKSEIISLIGQFWRARAVRRQVDVVAKLVVFGVEEGADEESVLVQDISSSGIRVQISRGVALDLKDLTNVHFLFSVQEGDEYRRLNLAAEFVRVAEVGDNVMSLAFRFTSLDPEEARLLERGSSLFQT